MALRGPAAKSVKHGRTPNADWTDVADVPYAGPWPELPKLPARQKWNELVLRWWEIVKTMPHCVLWDDADWQYAIETAYMKHYHFRDVANDEGTTSAATEIRRREDTMGTTMEARRKLRIRYVSAEEAAANARAEDEKPEAPAGGEPPTAKVTSLTERRRRLAG